MYVSLLQEMNGVINLFENNDLSCFKITIQHLIEKLV